MDDQVQATADQIIERFGGWVHQMVREATSVRTPDEAQALERRCREEGQRQLAQMMEDMLQVAVEAEDAGRMCPDCGTRRRHKGRYDRRLATSVGEVRLEGIYWQCSGCHRSDHSTHRICDKRLLSEPMRELVCLLGATQGSFEQAARVCEKLSGVRLTAPTLAAATEDEGRRLAEAGPAPPPRLVSGTLVGSCDGTMVNTREEGWRELKAWRFDDGKGRRTSGAALERADQFVPRLRREALAQHADLVECFVFVSDAAEWIKQGVAEFLPEASEHVIDFYHAAGHVHEAAKAIYGEQTERAGAWASRWCGELKSRGGREVWDRLRRTRFTDERRQDALRKLLGYLDRHAGGLDYPRYRREGIPISSGPMESTCKQLGQRLKGPGMRWKETNVSPMAALISLWSDDRWDQHWRNAA